MKLIFIIFAVVLVKCEDEVFGEDENFEIELDEEFLNAKSPMEMKFYLEIIQNNFPGLYDNVFAGVEGRIAGGNFATKGQFPYQVLIYMKDKNSNTFICGGGLVAYNWILTAAHCVHNFKSVSVHISTLHRLHIRSAFSGNVTSEELFIHPNYNPVGHANDIALIHLSAVKPSILDHPDVALMHLLSEREIGINLIGMDGTVAGFGSTSDTTKASDTLKFITMPIISNVQCQRIFGNFIRATHLCLSGNGGRSVCSGDSGGPLTVQISPGRNVAVGLVSFGHKHGCTLGHPGVFTRISSYLSWIESHIGAISKETSGIGEDSVDDGGKTIIASEKLIAFGLFFSVLILNKI